MYSDLTDQERVETGEQDDLLDEITEEFYDDPVAALERLDELGLDISDLPL